jgi:catechol-2,3-dioxygenase
VGKVDPGTYQKGAAVAETNYDRSAEDVGNIVMLEHVNLTVPDQGVAALFYVTGLGFTRDPYIDFGTFNMWVNLGEQQFHLPKSKAQKFRGHIGVVVPDLEDLKKRFKFIAKPMADTEFAWEEKDDHIAVTCPWGNDIRAYPAGSFPLMDLGMPYVDMQVPPDSAAGIARFYNQVLGAPASAEDGVARVKMGFNQEMRFSETDEPIADYDGHHIAVYVANFSGPHDYLAARQLITEESDQYQYRFQAIADPDSGETLTEIEHEVRSLSHAMYHRPLVNRNPAVNFFTYRKGNEIFTPA